MAVLVTGGYAAGRAAPTSDLDLTAILGSDASGGYRTWFADWPDAPLHVSVDLTCLDHWLARRHEPADWSLGFPTNETVGILWATDEARLTVGADQNIRRPAPDPQLEDFFEGAGK